MLLTCSYFSPLLKSVTKGTNVDYAIIDTDLQERENFIAALESRFLFLAADARSTLRLLNVGSIQKFILTKAAVKFSSFAMN